MNKRKLIPLLISVLILIILPLFAFVFTSNIPGQQPTVEYETLQTTWYDESNDNEVIFNKKYDIGVNEIYSIYTVIDSKENNFDTLLLESQYQEVNVYLEGQLIFSNSTKENRLFGKAEQTKYHLILLPEDIEGKEIKITYTSPFSRYSGSIEQVQIGYRTGLIQEILKTKIYYLLITVSILFSTIVLLFSSVLFNRSDAVIKRMISLVGAIFFFAFGLICESSVLSLYINGYLSGLSYLSFILFAVLFAYYMLISVSNNKRLRALLVIIFHLALAQLGFAIVAHFIDLFDLYQTSFITVLLILVELVIFASYKFYQVAQFEQNNKKAVFEAILSLFIILTYVLAALISYSDADYYIVPCILFLVYIFYKYALSIKDVIEDSKKAIEYQSQLKETKNYLIQSQMKSHFIFNTLGAIRTMIVSHPNQAYDMMTDFTKYLRANISNISPNEQIPFSQELDHIKAYVNIEKQRFQNRLNIEFDIQCDNFYIPPLSVEPLVENAVKHGVCKKIKGGTVTIATREKDDCYYVYVKDDGVGFNTNILNDESKKGSVGLKYIQIRLEQLANAEFNIKSVEGKGTKATIIIKKNNNR